MKSALYALVGAALLALPACGGSPSAPTTPTTSPPTPQLGPAQLSVQVTFSQPSSVAAGLVETSGLSQNRKANVQVSVTNGQQSVSATVSAIRFVFSLEGAPAPFVNTSEPPNAGFTIGTGATMTSSHTLAFPLAEQGVIIDPGNNPPFLFDVGVVWNDTLGNTGIATSTGTFDSSLTRLPPGTCTPDPTTLCVGPVSRFQIVADVFNLFPGAPSQPVMVGQRFNDGGHFYFFDPASPELFVQISNQCQSNGAYWFFFAGSTDVEFTLSVTDTKYHLTRTYHNPLGNANPVITDTSAFATCP